MIVIPEGKTYQFVASKKFCNSRCSVTFSNKHRKAIRSCEFCGNEITKRWASKFCSHQCQAAYTHSTFITQWKNGDINASICDGLSVSKHIRRHLFEKYTNQCCKCGWSKVNPTTGKIPLVINHIDGDSSNNVEQNLELICPSCDSLTPTYMALNKGKGREARRRKRLHFKHPIPGARKPYSAS